MSQRDIEWFSSRRGTEVVVNIADCERCMGHKMCVLIDTTAGEYNPAVLCAKCLFTLIEFINQNQ